MNGKLAGVIAIADQVKESAAEAVKALKAGRIAYSLLK